MESERSSQNMENLLIQIARKQRELLLTGFDMDTRKTIPVEKPKRGFFRRRGPTAREILCSELAALQHQAMDRLPDAPNPYWWKMRARIKGVFAVGCYKTDSSGCLTGFRSFDYHPVRIAPENLKHVLLARRIPGASIYKLCEFMSMDNNVQKIPFSLINGAASTAKPQTSDGGFALMCVKSVLFTLLADKLVLS